MTVYVDDMLMRADVPNGSRVVRGRWSHLIADTEEELHEFAARLGLRRSWFQEPKGIGTLPLNPESLKAQQWHYDVTMTKRAEAIRLGAVAVTQRQMAQIIKNRHQRLFPEAAAEYERRAAETSAKWANLRQASTPIPPSMMGGEWA